VSARFITSVRIEASAGPHEYVTVWIRGANVGTLVVGQGDGEELRTLLTGELPPALDGYLAPVRVSTDEADRERVRKALDEDERRLVEWDRSQPGGSAPRPPPLSAGLRARLRGSVHGARAYLTPTFSSDHPTAAEPCPADLKLDAHIASTATHLGVSPEQLSALTATFIEYWRGRGDVKRDWQGMLRRWLVSALDSPALHPTAREPPAADAPPTSRFFTDKTDRYDDEEREP